MKAISTLSPEKNSNKAFPIPHISASSMIKFSTNPLLFKIQYINGEYFDTSMNISGVIGQAFHHAMAVYSGGSDTLIPTSESEAMEYGLKAGMDYLERYNDGFISYSSTVENKQQALDKFSFAFNEYVKYNPYAKSKVIACEDEIKELIDIEWRGKKLSLPIKLKGFIDLVEDDGNFKLTDYKTCSKFSDPEKIDGKKIIQAVIYYLLAYVKYGIEPYSLTFKEVKITKNKDGSPQVKEYEIVYADNDLYFDFFFRFYEDMIRALNGQQVYVPNLDTLYDNEVGIIAYIHRLDIAEEVATLMKKHQVDTISELLKKEIQSAGNMRKLLKTIEENFVSAKNLNYEKMKPEEKIQTKLMEHGMMIQFDSVVKGSTVDLYRYTPSIGLKMARIRNYVDDIEQVLGISGVRVLAPIPNSTMVGFEIPTEARKFPELPKSDGFNIAMGETVMGEIRRFDIRQAPHMLVAGSTGSGKSVFLNGLIVQLQNINGIELHLFDPKQIELFHFEGKKNIAEYQSEIKEISLSLNKIWEEMEDRYSKMKKVGARNISEMKDMKYKFVVIDEFADLAMRGDVGNNIQMLAQKGRACGIHLILATQRASTSIINGDTKINFPVRIVFRMAKEVDSRVMLDEGGAEKLLGKGDCLFLGDNGVERLQAFRN